MRGVEINKTAPINAICHELNLFLTIKKKKKLPKKEVRKIRKCLKKYSELTSANENFFSNQSAGSSKATPYSGCFMSTFFISSPVR